MKPFFQEQGLNPGDTKTETAQSIERREGKSGRELPTWLNEVFIKKGVYAGSAFGPDRTMEYAHDLADRFWPARDHGMTTRRASELELAADFSCSGTFSAVGVIREPTLALSVAIRDLLLYRENPELKPVTIHVLATRVAGRCSIRSAKIRGALVEGMATRLALEWKITIPAIGAVRALFLVTRLGKTGETDVFDLVLQLASKPSFEAAQTQEEARPPRRACSLLRIF